MMTDLLLGAGVDEIIDCKGKPALPDCDWHSSIESANMFALGLLRRRVKRAACRHPESASGRPLDGAA
jgi:hypothetical protein